MSTPDFFKKGNHAASATERHRAGRGRAVVHVTKLVPRVDLIVRISSFFGVHVPSRLLSACAQRCAMTLSSAHYDHTACVAPCDTGSAKASPAARGDARPSQRELVHATSDDEAAASAQMKGDSNTVFLPNSRRSLPSSFLSFAHTISMITHTHTHNTDMGTQGGYVS